MSAGALLINILLNKNIMRKNAIIQTEKEYKKLNKEISKRLKFDDNLETKRYAPKEPYLFNNKGEILLPITDYIFEKCNDIVKDLKYEE
jgi:hypothetical protein